jgi:hypothetical protein
MAAAAAADVGVDCVFGEAFQQTRRVFGAACKRKNTRCVLRRSRVDHTHAIA